MKTIEPVKQDNREKATILSAKDLQISYFCGSGKGGQARNKVASGVMIRHEESGAMAKASDSRSQDENKQSAFQRLLKTPQMRFWIQKKLYEIKQQETVEESVDRELKSESHLRYEVKNDSGQWVEVPASHFETAEAKQD